MSRLLADLTTGGGGMALLAFAVQFGAGMVSLTLHPRLSPRERAGETYQVVQLATGMIVVMTSVVLGLLASSMNTTFSQTGQDMRRFASDLILADRSLRGYGPEALPARADLLQYARMVLATTWPASGPPGPIENREAGAVLDDAEQAILALRPDDPAQHARAEFAEQRLRTVLTLRWTLINEAHGTVSTPLIVVLILWLALVLAAFGYNAPRNHVVICTLLLTSASMAAAIFLIAELDRPFDGLLRISPAPMQLAVATMQG